MRAVFAFFRGERPAAFSAVNTLHIFTRNFVERLFQALAEQIPFSPTLADARTTLSYPAGTSH